MKNVMILSVFAVALCLVIPQPADASASKSQMQNEISIAQQKDVKYQEIANENIPAAVSKVFSNDYPGYAVDKAYKGDNGTYKLKVSKGDVKYVLYYEETGKFIKVEMPETSAK